MGMKRVYKCDICRSEKKPLELFGICFKSKGFKIEGYASTDGVHICIECAKMLKTELNGQENL